MKPESDRMRSRRPTMPLEEGRKITLKKTLTVYGLISEIRETYILSISQESPEGRTVILMSSVSPA